MKPRTIHLNITCTEYNIADTLRDLANFIEESDIDIDDIKEFEGDHYDGTLTVE